MRKTKNGVQIHLSNPDALDLRYNHNRLFIGGASSEPDLNEGSARSKLALQVFMLISGILLLAFWGFVLYTFIFNNLSIEVEGAISGVDGKHVLYTYEVDGVTYEKREPANRSSSAWSSGNAPHPVKYLSFQPQVSRLDFNIEKFDVGLSIMGTILLGGFTFAGYWGLRTYRRLSDLKDNATHIVEGTIDTVIRGRYGSKIVGYEAESPFTGEPIRGTNTIGRLEGAHERLQSGSPVAILYKDDKLHALL